MAAPAQVEARSRSSRPAQPGAAETRRHRGRRIARRAGKWAAGILIIGWSLAPIYWAAVVSLMTPAGLQSVPPSPVPRPFTLSYFTSLLNGRSEVSTQFLTAMRNSVIESAATTLVTVTIALLAAYPFARWTFRGSRAAFLIILGTFALPVYAVLIPLFQFISRIHADDTYQAIVAINVSASLPLAIWLLRAHIAALPPDLENAARIDGAGSFTVLRRIVLPLTAPGIAAATVLVFLTSWAAYLIPLTFAPTLHSEPLTVLIPQYTSKYAQDYGLQAAAGLIALIPPAAVVIWLNRYLLRGLLTGALKQ
jgi:multiple sugar transport system permease protein